MADTVELDLCYSKPGECSNVLCSGFAEWTLPVCMRRLSTQEFSDAWSWPARVRWNVNSQELVDDYGVLPDLSRRGDRAIWHTLPNQPIAMMGSSRLDTAARPHSYHLSGRR